MRVYRTRKTPLLAAWDRLCEKLAAAGFRREPHEGPLDLLARIEAQNSQLARAVRPLIQHYVAIRYAPPPSGSAAAAALPEFIRRVRRLRLA
jgi:hypothetical protein